MMNKIANFLKIFAALFVLFVFTCAHVSAQTLLDGKKWTRTDLNTNKPSSGFMAGGMQGAAIYNGNLYQFRTNGTSGVNYDVYNVSSGTWTSGKALTCLPSSHAGSACFGTKVFTTSDGYTNNCTMPFLYVTNGQTIQIVDVENDKLVATWTLASALQDDAIAAYDFVGNTLYSIGYVTGSRKAPYIVRSRTGIDFTAVPTNQTITFTDTEKTSFGGPDAEGIQHDLVNGTIQDCQYVDGKIYFCAGGGSSAHRTEFCRVHVYDTSSKSIVETKMCTDVNEAEGLVYDATSQTFVMTTLNKYVWKLSAGSGYDSYNFQPATKNGEYYEIGNASQLLWFKQQVYGGCADMKARLTTDIDMNGVTDPFSYYVYDYNIALAGKTTPTYPSTFAFRGEFDGQSHIIKNYSITSTPYYYCGLFPYVIGANIHDVTVKGSIKLSQCDAMVQNGSSWTATSNQPIANVGLIGYMDGGELSNVNSFITIDETVAGVSGTINKLVGGTGSTAPTTTNCLTEDPSQKTHAENGGKHYYENGFCVCTDATTSEDGYYQPATLDTDGYYKIANAGNLFWFANQVNAGNATYNAKVTADIDMDGDNHKDFPGIGYYVSTAGGDRKPFSGNFDGQEHRIFNCDITTNNSSYWGSGLIGYAYATGSPKKEIKNFTLEGKVTAKCGARAGGVLGYVADGYSISGITSSVEIESTTLKTGGLAGFVSTSTVSKCRFNGKITNSNNWTAGLIAEVLRSCTISDCLFDGTVNATRDNADVATGGIAAVIGGASANTVSNCLSYGTITTKKTGTNTGKVFGRVDGALTLSNVYYGAQGTSTPTIDYNPNGKTITGSVTTITTQTWDEIKTALNNGSTNWGISSKDYPIPGEVDATQYTVTFNAMGGSECAPVKKVANSVITLPTSEKAGYVFTGWNTAEDGSGTSYAAGASYTVTANVTLYAQWTEAFTITFNSNGGSACASVTKVANSVITLPTTTKDGYIFAGWTVAEDGSGTSYAAGANYTITANATLYAQWKEAYTITFNSKGGSACASVTNVAGTEITLPTPTRDDYIFNGWNTAEDGSGTSYAAGASYTITASATLYAQWTLDEAGDYRNGFHKTHAKTADDYYQEPVLLTADKCTEIGIATTYAGYYQVKNAGNMFWIAKKLSADNNTRKYVMTADIDMAGDDANHKDWAGIGKFVNGNSDYNFKGTFDGLGHKFTNYYMSVTGSDSWKAMFCVPNGATIKNFTVSGSIDISSTGSQFGTVGGRIAGTTTIEDIHSSVNITVATGKTPASIGGIVGQCSAQTSFNRCRYSGTITGNSAYKNLGGIFGNAEGILTINNCLFDGTITSTSTKVGSGDDAIQIAGVGGRNNKKTTITNCLMIGTITVPSNSEAVDAEKTHSGIIFGYQKTTADLTITNTYYSTSKCTSGIRAVGLSEATSQSKAAPTAITTQSWRTIKKKLNLEPAVGATVNWNIVEPIEYPIPMVNIEPEAVGTYYNIKFYDKATSTLLKEIEVLEDHDLEVPAEALKEGYDVTWEPALVSPVTANASYYGTYTINEYTITYMSEGSQFAQQTYEYGAAVTAPAEKPTKGNGYVFDHWDPALPTTMPAKDLTVTAVFAEAPYEISTFAELKAFRDIVNSVGGATKNAKLVADIDCGGEAFGEPIGVNTNAQSGLHSNPSNPYVGTFDGQGHKITNLKIESAGHFVGLFGYAGVGGNANKAANIKNLSVSGTISTSFLATVSSNCTQSHLGTIGCLMNGTVSGIISNIKLTNSGCTDAHFGGIVGCTYAYVSKKTIKNCAYIGTMEVDAYDCLGGILGYSQGGVEITNCYFGGKIDQTCTEAKKTLMGGIIGYISSGTQDGRAFPITNNVSNGTLIVKTTGSGTASNVLLNQAGLDKTYINGNYATSGTIATGFGTVKAMTMAEIEEILGFSVNLYVDGNGDISANNIISVDAAKNYYLKVLNLGDLADAPTWPADAKSVKANKVIYTRAGTYMTNGFISVCMPFALNADNLPGGSDCKVKVFDQVKDENGSNVVYFKDATKENDAYAAGVPYFLYLPESARQQEWSVTLSNEDGITLVMEVSNPDDATRGIYGSFTTIKTGAWSESAPTYKIASDGKTLVKTTATSSCYPYRAYLKLPENSNGISAYRMSFDDLEDESDTAIDAFEELQSEQPCYNLQGQPVTSPTKGIVITGGKKYIIR